MTLDLYYLYTTLILGSVRNSVYMVEYSKAVAVRFFQVAHPVLSVEAGCIRAFHKSEPWRTDTYLGGPSILHYDYITSHTVIMIWEGVLDPL